MISSCGLVQHLTAPEPNDDAECPPTQPLPRKKLAAFAVGDDGLWAPETLRSASGTEVGSFRTHVVPTPAG